uniref:PHD-type domain-containing protein n=2 Tax=Haemonchus contortus TaxID=6289 RepID=A0A7I5EB97_HAECO
MTSSSESVKFLQLRNGDRINVNSFCNITYADDSKLPSDQKAAVVLQAYKEHFKASDVSVPAAEYKAVDSLVTALPPRRRPEQFIKFVEKTKSDYDRMVEYDCDEEDYLWIKNINKERKKNKASLLLPEQMEQVMDRLEKESHFEVKGSPSSIMPGSSMDGDDVCCVCGDGDVNNVNQIIYCDMCNIAVHQDCYGVPYIPEGQWLCRRCKLSPSAQVECCLCPNTSGAFKQTSDGRWAHVICAIWLNEVHFGNLVFLEPIEGVDASLERRCKLKCLVCRKKMGACLQCSTRSCLKAFHVTCAQQSGMTMKIESSLDPNNAEMMDVQRFVYCHLHADDDESDPAARKKRMDEAIRRARRSMAAKTCKSPSVNMPTLSVESLESIKALVGFDIEDIVQYWYLKRKSRCGVPLIRRLQLNQKVSRTSNFPASELAQEDQRIYEQFMMRRVSLETTRLLCEQVKKRESHKKSHRKVSAMLMSMLLKPQPMILEELVDRLSEKDKDKIFTSPVTVDGYRDFIKHPMDLSTMRKKLEKGKYDSIGALRTDVLLMTDNCEKFNLENPYFLQYGRKFRKIALGILDKEEERERSLEKLLSSDLEQSFLKEVSRVGLYDVLESEVMKEESEQESDTEKIQRNNRPRTVKDASVVTTETKRAVGGLGLGSFLVPNESNGGLFNINGTTPKPKRRNSPTDHTPIHKRRRKDPIFIKSPFRQSPITKFLSSNLSTGRRSTLRHHVAAPLMAFRDNSVKSPLSADIPSSESSAEEEDGRANRRRARLGEHAKLDIEELSDFDGYHHNDLVVVDGIAGRVIDPVDARVDGGLPSELVTECRTSAHRRDSHICVYLFENENKWGWYPSRDVRYLNTNGDNMSSLSSFKLAMKWHKKMIDTYSNKQAMSSR